jgi:DNA-binding MarR family transcriptional regulator
MKPSTAAGPLDLDALPGHAIRRLQQIAVAIFLEEAEPHGLTPIQYGALQAIVDAPGMDQRTLAARIGLDTSTTAGVIDRLEARGLVLRSVSREDRRIRQLSATDAGQALQQAAVPAMLRCQERILAPLPPAERAAFMRMLHTLVDANNALSRAPRTSGP